MMNQVNTIVDFMVEAAFGYKGTYRATGDQLVAIRPFSQASGGAMADSVCTYDVAADTFAWECRLFGDRATRLEDAYRKARTGVIVLDNQPEFSTASHLEYLGADYDEL